MGSQITIIGTGLAGYNLAREIRKQLPDVALRLFSQDSGDFYSKPMLSNGLAQNKTAAQLAMKSVDKMKDELRAEVHNNDPVVSIDVPNKRVIANSGTYDYDNLVLALGADAFNPVNTGDGADAILTVNDLEDYARYRHRLEACEHVTLLGGGLIGCEFANDLKLAGKQVEVVDMASWPLSRLLPEACGRYLQSRLEETGIRFHLGSSVTSVDKAAKGYKATLDNQSVIDTDLVLSAVGLRPRIGLAGAAGISVGRGIQVDRLLRTSAPNVFALGDCAQVEGHVMPYVLPIMQCVRALASTLAGNATSVNYPAMPVVVKTPGCPVVVSAPHESAVGEWQIETVDAGIRALFVGPTGDLLGMALLGSTVSERQALAPRLPPVMSS